MQRAVYEYISKKTADPIIEWKACAVIGKEFAIFQSDLDFYEKISPSFGGKKYLIPAPTLCPEERQRRRMARKNDHMYFKRKCDLSGESIVSIYHTSVQGPVYKVKHRWGDEWNALDYEKNIIFTRSFVEQYKELYDVVPKITMVNDNGIGSENCEYCQNMAYSKDCYLNTVSWKLRDCYYSSNMGTGEFIIDSFFTMDSQICYECVEGYNLYQCFYLQNCGDCSNCFFGYELKGCTHCAFCVGLSNKEHCIFNKQYSKEEYTLKIEEMKKSFVHDTDLWRSKWLKFLSQFPRKSMYLIQTEGCYGNNLVNSQNSLFCYNLKNVKDCKYRTFGDTGVSGVDLTVGGELELCYEGIVPDHSHQAGFTIFCWKCDDIWYSEMCHGCKHCFGCVGLKNQEYCILNKQYTKQEYNQLVPKIIALMKKYKEWGEFFPIYMSPFAYNHTIAQDYFSLESQEVSHYGSFWLEEKEEFNVPEGMETIGGKDLFRNPYLIDDSILEKAIRCERSYRPFRIMPKELEFYRKYNISLPKKHPLERYRDRLSRMPEKQLYLRKCDKCGKEILSVYSHDAGFKVYCESCYNKEIYG